MKTKMTSISADPKISPKASRNTKVRRRVQDHRQRPCTSTGFLGLINLKSKSDDLKGKADFLKRSMDERIGVCSRPMSGWFWSTAMITVAWSGELSAARDFNKSSAISNKVVFEGKWQQRKTADSLDAKGKPWNDAFDATQRGRGHCLDRTTRQTTMNKFLIYMNVRREILYHFRCR